MLLTYFWENWRYSNAPEGERPFEKVFGLAKFGFGAGVGVGIYDSVLISQTGGFWTSVNCISYWVVPFTAMCATFASVAYTTTKIRGKDDYFNYILASLATTGVFYKWQKNGMMTHSFAFFLITVASIKKYGQLNNWNPLPSNLNTKTQYTTFPYDFTIVKDPRRKSWE